MKLIATVVKNLAFGGVIWFAIIWHWIAAVCLFLSDDPLKVTAIYSASIAENAIVTSFAYFFASLFAFFAMLRDKADWKHLLLVAPQQTLLFMSAWGSWEAIKLSHYADGTEVSRYHMITDQSVFILLALGHFVSMIYPFVANNKK